VKISRAIGQTSQILNLFVQDGSVSTGAGLANIPATTVSYTWFHNTQAAVSTGTGVSTASMGNYTSGAWTQISSSLALGWYQFGIPDGALATGDCVGLHLYVSTGAFAMVPLPVEIELVRDNPLQFTTSKVFLAHTSTSPANIVQIQGQNAVTSASGILNVSTQTLDKTGYIVNVSSWANSSVVATSSGIVDVNLVNIWNKSAVTSASGQLTVSTQTVDKTGYIVNVSSWANSSVVATSSGIVDVNLVNIWNKSAVTSASGQLQVSTQSLVGIVVSTQTMNFKVNVSSWANSTVVATSSGIVDVNLVNIWNQSAVTSGAGILNVSTQTIDKTGYSLGGTTFANVVQIYSQPAVTSGSGILNVSTQSLAGIVVSTQSLAGIVVSTQTIDKTGYSLTAAEEAAIAGVVLSTTQAESYRASSAVGSITQLMYEVLANVTDMGNSGTTRALNSVTSHAVNGLQYQYDSTTPSSITRIA
jgi:hypothetical protein